MGLFVAIAGAIIGAVSATAQAVGGMNAAAAAEEAGKRNAAEAELAAKDAEKRGGLEAGRAKMEGSRAVGAQQAALGASGVSTGSGSAGQLKAESEALSEVDAETIKLNARREARGYRRQGKDFQAKAAAQADSARWSAVGSVLGGAGGVASSIYGMKGSFGGGGGGGSNSSYGPYAGGYAAPGSGYGYKPGGWS